MVGNRINDERRTQASEGRGIDPVAYLYDRPVLFYVLATAIPWACWFAAAYLSHLPSQTTAVLTGTLVLSVAGLLAPIAVVIGLVWHKPVLRKDIWRRMAWPTRAPL